MEVTFIGASREVTGSAFLVTVGSRHVLVECGMEQGRDTYENQRLPVSPAMVDAVVLTHAHIDHSGMLPALYKKGFRGVIHATPATHALCDIMLRDSAHIQETEAEWRNRKAERSGEAPYEPLYTQEDAEGALNQFAPLPYGERREIMPGCTLAFTDAGHLLGSASATLRIDENGQSRSIVFSGDIGNIRQPIINDPDYLKEADFVVMETTYGDREHGPAPDYIADLADALQTAFDRGGNVVIPSFAVGRTQEILYFLREIKEKGRIRGHEGFPVYLDSPLAIKATQVFQEAGEEVYDPEMKALLDRGVNPLRFDDLRLSVTAEDSKQINFEKRPCVIISASGMAEAGRIRHHLKHNLWKPEAMVLFVGYQSAGTLGRLLIDGVKTVRLFNDTVQVKAQIRQLRAISGHADQSGLLKWIDSFTPRPKRVFLTHGDEEVMLAFAALLRERGYNTFAPYSGDAWDLSKDAQSESGPRALAASGRKPREEQKKSGDALDAALQSLAALVGASGGMKKKAREKVAQRIMEVVRKWEG